MAGEPVVTSLPDGRVNFLSGPAPLIMVDATDALACPLISAYEMLCRKHGASEEYLASLQAVYNLFADWQEAHPERVKNPGVLQPFEGGTRP